MKNEFYERWLKRGKLTTPALYILALAIIATGQRQFSQTQRVEIKRYKPEIVVSKGHINPVEGLAFSPDGRLLASSGDGLIKLWDVETKREIRTINTNVFNFLKEVAFNSDGKILFTAGDEEFAFWDVDTGNKISFIKRERLQGRGFVPAEVNFSVGKIAESGSDGNLTLFDIATSRKVKEFKCNSKYISSFAFSPDGTILACSGNDGIKLWDARSEKELRTIADKGGTLAFGSNGRILVSGDSSGNVKLWNVEDGSLIASRRIGTWVRNITVNSTATTIALEATIDNRTYTAIWQREKQIEPEIIKEYYGSLVFSPNSNLLALGGIGVIKLWNIETNQIQSTLGERRNYILGAGVDQNGKEIFFAQTEPFSISNLKLAVKILKVDSNSKLDLITQDFIEVHDVKLNPDGQTFAVTGYKKLKDSKTMPIWSVYVIDRNGKTLHNFEEWGDIYRIEFSPNGNILAGIGFSTIIIWDVKTGMQIQKLDDYKALSARAWTVGFSADGKSILTASDDNIIRAWDIESGKALQSLRAAPYAEWAVAFQPNNQVVASLIDSNEITLWSITDNTKIHTLKGHNPSTNTITFSSDGKILISTGFDGTIKFWNVADGKELATLIPIGENDWVVTTPEGLFDSSDSEIDTLHFIVGVEVIELKQLKSRYYSPGLLSRILKGERLSETVEFAITLFPAIEAKQLKQKANQINLELTNRGGGIGRVEVHLNGKELIADARIGKKINSRAATINLPVEISKNKLRSGSNKIEVIAWNLEGDVRSRSKEIFLNLGNDGLLLKGTETINLESEKIPSEINFYAIISGISDYAGNALDLRYAAKDAEDISKALSLAARKYFCNEELANKKPCKRVHLRLLSTEQEKRSQFTGLPDVTDFIRLKPNKQNFKEVFAEVAKNAKPEDVVLVYLSGHGTAITSDDAVKESAFPDMYLYATQDATTLDRIALANQTQRESKTISSLELAKWVFDIKADKKVMIFDTCAAGAAQKDLTAMTKAVDALQVRSIDRLRERTGFYILMGSASDTISYEANQYRQGLLTYSLIEAMTTDRNLRDGKFLDIENWFAFAEDRVEDLAKGIGGIQRPSFFKSNFAKTFDIGRIESDEQKQIHVAQPVPLILQPELREKDKFTDKERLTEKLEARLIEQSFISNRREISTINYSKATSAANGISPRGVYVVNADNTISVEVSLIREEEEIQRIRVLGTREDVIEKLLQEIIKVSLNK